MSKLLLGIALLLAGCAAMPPRVPCYEAIGAIPKYVLILNKCEGELFLILAPQPEQLAPTPGEKKADM